MFLDQYRCNTKILYFADTITSSETSILKFKANNYEFLTDWWYINILFNPVNPPLVPRFTVSTPEHNIPFEERLPTLYVLL